MPLVKQKLPDLPALTIRQPWAEFVIAGWKTKEWRSWPTDYRGPFYVHAAARPAKNLKGVFREYYEEHKDVLRYGGLIGIAELLDCIRDDKSGLYFFHVRPVRRIRFIALPGALKFFRLSAGMRA